MPIKIKTAIFFVLLANIILILKYDLLAESKQRIPRLKNEVCECAVFNVLCLNDLQISKHCNIGAGQNNAAACAIGCSIAVNQSVCKQHDLESKEYSFAQFNDRLGCDMKDIAARLTALNNTASDYKTNVVNLVKEIDACSVLAHEAFHSCAHKTLGNLGELRTLACNEWGGMTVSYTMYVKAVELLCENDKQNNPPGKPSLFCKYLCADLFNAYVYVDWLSCVCSASESISSGLFNQEWLTHAECCSCNRNCHDSQAGLKNYKSDDYCKREVFELPEFKNQILPKVTESCDTIAFDPGHYSCNRFSRKDYDYSAKCK